MKKTILYLLFGILCNSICQAQTQSPEQFLGYPLGTRFTPHHRIIAYFEHAAKENPKMVVLKKYGESNELRPLMVAYISTPENISNIEAIRTDNLKRAGILTGTPVTNIPVTWLSYNVHGNEAVSSEACMQTLWELVDAQHPKTKEWLAKTLVVIDPCLNPDGRDRYANWYNQKMNTLLQPDPQSIEHQEPWPGGRPNHYLFDLNRDWAWQTQKETQARVKLYDEWLPQIHVDFHEQSVEQPYYFAPAAEPLHQQLSAFQHAFQDSIGRNHARYFDQQNWLYFTKERFDILYPSYGDSYPMFNGSVGMTYEQGGGGRAGIGILNRLEDTVTLKSRIEHHHTTGLSTIEMAARHADVLLKQFTDYFKENSTQPKGTYKSFIIKAGKTPERLALLLELLDKNGIRYGSAPQQSGLRGFSYLTGKDTSFSSSQEDLVVNAYQTKSVLTQVLFEPKPQLNDSITYDITSWALPYAFGLEAYAVNKRVDATGSYEPTKPTSNTQQKPMAYLAPWHATNHVRFLAALLKEGIRVRYANYPFNFGDKLYPSGTLLILREGNTRKNNFDETVIRIASELKVPLQGTFTAYVDKGKDFGSPDVLTIKAPKVALVSGAHVSSLNFGELWHFFEQQLEYPLSVLDQENLGSLDLSKYNTLILPNGNYANLTDTIRGKIREWISQGGKVIALEGALDFFADKKGFTLSNQYAGKSKREKAKLDSLIKLQDQLSPYQQRERLAASRDIQGAIFEVSIDETHPLGFGLGKSYYTLKNNAKHYAYLPKGYNIGTISSMSKHRTGYVGNQAQIIIQDQLALGVENIGKGQVIYMVDNPLFRGFWENGKLLFGNALFMSGQ